MKLHYEYRSNSAPDGKRMGFENYIIWPIMEGRQIPQVLLEFTHSSFQHSGWRQAGHHWLHWRPPIRRLPGLTTKVPWDSKVTRWWEGNSGLPQTFSLVISLRCLLYLYINAENIELDFTATKLILGGIISFLHTCIK